MLNHFWTTFIDIWNFLSGHTGFAALPKLTLSRLLAENAHFLAQFYLQFYGTIQFNRTFLLLQQINKTAQMDTLSMPKTRQVTNCLLTDTIRVAMMSTYSLLTKGKRKRVPTIQKNHMIRTQYEQITVLAWNIGANVAIFCFFKNLQ